MPTDFEINLPLQGPPGVPGTDGTPGLNGDAGPRGPAVSILWDFATYDGVNGPESGQVMFDPSGTIVLFSKFDRYGSSVLSWLVTIGDSTNTSFKGDLYLQQSTDESRWVMFHVTGPAASWGIDQIAVPTTLVSGSLTPLDPGEIMSVHWAPAGDKGQDGAGGDMFGANNLSEVVSPLTAFNTIKQAATTTYAGVSVLFKNYLSGFITSIDPGDALHDVAVQPGMAMDAAGTILFSMTTAIVKRIDAAWSLGTAGGGMDTGSVAANTWYYVYAINRTDSGVTDVCFSLSNTAPTFGVNIPGGYTKYRRIGSLRTKTGPAIWKFFQYGDRFMWESQFGELEADGAAATLLTLDGAPRLTVPPIVILGCTLQCYPQETNVLLVSDPAAADITPNNDVNTIFQANTTADGIIYGSAETQVRCDSSARVRYAATSERLIIINTKGYIDLRGKDG